VKGTIDCSPPKSLDRINYQQRNRLFRERQAQIEHERNVARSLSRVAEIQRSRTRADAPVLVQRRTNPHSRVKQLVPIAAAVPPQRNLCKRLGADEDLCYALGAAPTPLAHLRPVPRPARV
jgi:hypothetical protein